MKRRSSGHQSLLEIMRFPRRRDGVARCRVRHVAVASGLLVVVVLTMGSECRL